MKTPEEMAEEYRKAWGDEQLYKIRHEHKRFEWSDALVDGFLAGYKAAKDQVLARFKSLLSSFAETSFNPNHTAWQIFDTLNENQAAQDQLADVSKVMPQWLSVKDRLPEINTGFIGFVENKEVCNCYRYPDSLRDGSPVFYAQSKAGLFICSLESVSHWQPLPAPPKEEK